MAWHFNLSDSNAIWVCNGTHLQVPAQAREDSFDWIPRSEITFFSANLTQNERMWNIRLRFDDLENVILGTDRWILVSGDFSVNALEWDVPQRAPRENESLKSGREPNVWNFTPDISQRFNFEAMKEASPTKSLRGNYWNHRSSSETLLGKSIRRMWSVWRYFSAVAIPTINLCLKCRQC